jgi:hypothetical protein
MTDILASIQQANAATGVLANDTRIVKNITNLLMKFTGIFRSMSTISLVP